MENFWNGFEKQASAEEAEKHHVRRFFLGNPISSAIEAKKGKKMESFGKAYVHKLVSAGKGLSVGAASGALAGLAASALSKGRFHPGHAALLGAVIGGGLGGNVMAVKATHDTKASKIHGEHSKYK